MGVLSPYVPDNKFPQWQLPYGSFSPSPVRMNEPKITADQIYSKYFCRDGMVCLQVLPRCLQGYSLCEVGKSNVSLGCQLHAYVWASSKKSSDPGEHVAHIHLHVLELAQCYLRCKVCVTDRLPFLRWFAVGQ